MIHSASVEHGARMQNSLSCNEEVGYVRDGGDAGLRRGAGRGAHGLDQPRHAHAEPVPQSGTVCAKESSRTANEAALHRPRGATQRTATRHQTPTERTYVQSALAPHAGEHVCEEIATHTLATHS
jgi:hypothetical protein